MVDVFIALLAFLVAVEYLVIAFDIVPRLAGIARVDARTIMYARWGATAFLAGCAITHTMIGLQTLHSPLRGGMDMEMAGESDVALILEMVIPHLAQVIGGALFIWISKSRLDLTITSKEEAADLRDLHRQLRSAFDLAPLGIAFSSAGSSSGALYINPAFERIFGSAAVAPTEAAVAGVYPADRAALSATISRVQAGEPADLEFRLAPTDGPTRWIHARWNPVTDTDGAVTARAVTIVEDITDRKNAYAALADSEQRFVRLANSVLVGINLRQLEPPQFLWANAAYREIVGADPSQDTSTPVDPALVLLHPDDRDRVMGHYWPLARAGQVAESEHRVLRPDGLLRWVHVTSNPVLDETGVVNQIVGTVEDITDRKNVQAAQAAHLVAQRANVAKSEFLSRVSHELRTPLNAVLGFGQLLELDPLSQPQQDAVGHILRAGRHLLLLVDDVLDISRIDSHQLDIRLEPVGVAGLASDVIAMIQPMATAGNITVGQDPGRCTVASCVEADRRRLQQVLLNLLSNAVKYNNPGGSVRVGWADGEDGNVQITVADTGVGIREEDLPRLFTPFERLGQQGSAIEGTGIGLALSHRLVTEMSGTLYVHSILGQGSTFTISLPSIDPAENLAMGGTPHAASQEGIASTYTTPIQVDPTVGDLERARPAANKTRFGAPKTVLYIEDNPTNVELLRQILAYRPNVTLRVAMLGCDGLEMALTDPPDLILLDLHLPDISGQEVLHRLRADPSTATTPIVILSADATPDQPQWLIALGATSYQTKPVKVPLVLDLIDRLEEGEVQPPGGTIASHIKINPISGPDPTAAALSINDGVATTLSTFRHEMVNLLGVVLTYCDLLANDETHPSKLTWLEKQGTATEQAIELTQELRVQ